ncbi:hypothetical protein AAG906_016182 [Vitis piasezkii]
MDAILQILKKNICLGTPFFNSFAKKPLVTMDDLFKRANKYSMLKDDILLQSHEDALILTPGISSFDVRRVLIDPGNSIDLLQMSVYSQMGLLPSTLENPGWILSGFNGALTTSLGDIVLPVQVGPITQNV